MIKVLWLLSHQLLNMAIKKQSLKAKKGDKKP